MKTMMRDVSVAEETVIQPLVDFTKKSRVNPSKRHYRSQAEIIELCRKLSEEMRSK